MDTACRGRDRRALAIVAGMPVCRHPGGLNLHLSFGRVVDSLAERYDRVLLCMPTADMAPDQTRDYTLKAGNVELVPQPAYQSTMRALRHPIGICRAYVSALRRADDVFMRGMLPFAGVLYLFAAIFRHRPCHWIVGNPVALLKSHRRSSRVKDALSIAYAWQDRCFTKLGRWLTRGAFICNGRELADIHSSPRTAPVVSSTITADEFHVREDTHPGEVIRILFVGFVRPEKGVEYLIEGMAALPATLKWELTIVGPWEQYSGYKRKLDDRVSALGIGDRIRWEGYVSYGPGLWEYLRSHDVLVLPTLSEGTPRVLVEARANSLPVVATRVGGIPTSLTDGHDGLLVPPKDAEAIADAIRRLVSDGALRRRLIRNGLLSAREMTVDRFVDRAMHYLSGADLRRES